MERIKKFAASSPFTAGLLLGMFVVVATATLFRMNEQAGAWAIGIIFFSLFAALSASAEYDRGARDWDGHLGIWRAYSPSLSMWVEDLSIGYSLSTIAIALMAAAIVSK
jgi:hypothetical protein